MSGTSRSIQAGFAFACTLALAACEAPVTSGDDVAARCAADLPPDPPTWVSPKAGRRDVTVDNFAIEATGLVDPDGDPLDAIEAEIWTLADDGTLRERAWWATVVTDHPVPIALADGFYDNAAAFVGGLAPWRDHAVRVRYVSRNPDGCTAAGSWSDPRVFRTDDGSAPLFDATVIRDFRVTLPAASYAAINAEANPPGCVPFERSYHTGTLDFDDVTSDGVGVKIKGGCGSSRDLSEKAALKISLDWDDPAIAGCPAARRIRGLDSFTLNNMVQDGSLSHERLAYELFRRMGVPVPRTAPARLWVNGAFFGYYLHLETVNRRFLDRHFGSNQGMLYEGTYNCDLRLSNIADDDSRCITREFRPDPCDGAAAPDADPEDYAPLRAMIARIDALPDGGFYPAITQIIDWDQYLSMWAVEVMLSHWDGYTYNIVNNWRIYHDPSTDLWTIIPSGLDQTFDYDSLTPWSPNGKLAQRCLAEAPCTAAFAARLAEANLMFQRMDLEAMRAGIQAQLAPLLAADPGREFTQNRFASGHNETAMYIQQQPGYVRALLAAHGF